MQSCLRTCLCTMAEAPSPGPSCSSPIAAILGPGLAWQRGERNDASYLAQKRNRLQRHINPVLGTACGRHAADLDHCLCAGGCTACRGGFSRRVFGGQPARRCADLLIEPSPSRKHQAVQGGRACAWRSAPGAPLRHGY
jgi:hypothetical protein